MQKELDSRLSLPYQRPPDLHTTSSSYLRASVAPYIQLARLDKPVGVLYLYFPCLIGTLFAASLAQPVKSPSELFAVNITLLAISVVMRGGGCSWNDTVDQDVDRLVERTRHRPLARGALSTSTAHMCTLCQLLAVLALQVLLLPPSCLHTSILFIVAIGVYPYMKRVTDYPQLFLGIPASWGIVIAFPALSLDSLSSNKSGIATASLLLANFAWMVLSDMCYAFQDLKDDIKAGVRSMAVKHQHHPKIVLSLLAFLQVGSLLMALCFMEADRFCFVWVFVDALTVAGMIFKVDLEDPVSCGWWFKSGCLMVNGTIVVAFLSEYIRRAAF